MLKNIVLGAIGAAGIAVVHTAPAAAQANRTFVSGQGLDTNPCSLPAPCRSFAQAITQTNAGGEIVVLDSAGYGAVTITKSISINNQDGVEAGITVTSASDGISVTAGPIDVVNLRGLTLIGSSTGVNGITFNSGANLNIDHCVIHDFTHAGINVLAGAHTALNVIDTTISGNLAGVSVTPATGSGPATTALKRVQLLGNGDGLFVNNGGSAVTRLTLTDSLVSSNITGVIVQTTPSGNAAIMIANTDVVQNSSGITIGGNAVGYIGHSTLFNYSQDVPILPTSLFSFGDNRSVNVLPLSISPH